MHDHSTTEEGIVYEQCDDGTGFVWVTEPDSSGLLTRRRALTISATAFSALAGVGTAAADSNDSDGDEDENDSLFDLDLNADTDADTDVSDEDDSDADVEVDADAEAETTADTDELASEAEASAEKSKDLADDAERALDDGDETDAEDLRDEASDALDDARATWANIPDDSQEAYRETRSTIRLAANAVSGITDELADEIGNSDASGFSADINVYDHDDYGEILVDKDGETAYVFELDSTNESACDCDPNSGAPANTAQAALPCATKWPPIFGSDPTASDDVEASVDSFERDECPTGEQISVDGKPVYLNVQDADPGDVKGPSTDSGGGWALLDPSGDIVSI